MTTSASVWRTVRRVELAHAERTEAARPVERLGDARRLAELELAEARHEPRHLHAQPLVELGHLEGDDLGLDLDAGEVDEEVETAPDEGLGELAGAVGGEHDHRPLAGAERAQLGDAHLEVGEHLEEEGLELGIGLVHLVDQQDDLARRRDGV